MGQLLSGEGDCRWIELDCGVYDAARDGDRLKLAVVTETGKIDASVAGWGEEDVPGNWVGAKARLRGVGATVANAARQRVGVLLLVNSREDVVFEGPLPEDPFAVEATRIADLLRSRPGAVQDGRVKVTGSVTHVSPGGRIAAQDDSGGMFVELASAGKLPVCGERIEVLGFPQPKALSPTLEQAVWREAVAGPKPEPAEVSVRELLAGGHHARRVVVSGKVLDVYLDSFVPVAVLQDGDEVVRVALPGIARDEVDRLFVEGSEVKVVGVCETVRKEHGRAPEVSVLVADTGDVETARSAPLLNPRQALTLGGGLLLAAAAAFAWVIALRRRVRRQTREITERFLEGEELRSKLQDLFENAGDIVCAMDRDGRLNAANAAAETAFGRGRTELAGMRFSDLVVEEDKAELEGTLRRLRDGESAPPLTIRFDAGRQAPVVVEAGLRLVHRDGEFHGFQCIGRDVTERKQLEAQVQQMQKLESVGQLAAGAAHDYNNMLTVILANTGLLLEESDLEESIVETVQEVQSAATRASHLTRQLLAYSRKQVMEKRPVILGGAVGEMTRMLKRLLGEHVELRTQLPAELPPVLADPGMLEQIVVNLCVNARDAMPQGGTLSIGAGVVDIHDTQLFKNAEAMPGEHVRLTFSDTGTGMDRETLEHIFEPFFTTKEVGKGSGLGLSTVFGIVKQHGGWIEAGSRPGKGATFRIYLPVATEGPAGAVSANAGEAKRGAGTILAVEDDPSVRYMLVSSLRRLGYEVHAAENGPEATRLWPEIRDKVDLLITDMVMPGGMNGCDVAAALREDRPDLRVIFSTGYSEDLLGVDMRELDGVFLRKAYSRTQLSQVVYETMETVAADAA